MKNNLESRMKNNYEDRFRYYLPRRTNIILRLDGKGFSTYTKNLRIFDRTLMNDLELSTIHLLKEMQGGVLAYIQSDEVSILINDFKDEQTQCWFDGNIQKIVSVASSIFTAKFNSLRTDDRLAYFDARIFIIPDRTEVMNYFIWRNNDCVRNSVATYAQSLFSAKRLHKKNQKDMMEMIEKETGTGWGDLTEWKKYGSLHFLESLTENRMKWSSSSAWKFTQNKEKLLQMIPQYPK